MKVIIHLSGENPDLPFAEVQGCGTLISRYPQVAIAGFPKEFRFSNLAYAHSVLEYIGECEATEKSINELIKEKALSTKKPFCVRVKAIQGCKAGLTTPEIEKMIGELIEGPVSLSNPSIEYRGLLSGGRFFFGILIYKADYSDFASRKPGKRPFFHPGVMMPKFARGLINIAGLSEGEKLLDPFSGTGGILIEASLLHIIAIGTDADPIMTKGSRINCKDTDICSADVLCLPFKDNSFEGVVTDFPYGQSSRVRAPDKNNLYISAMAEISRVLIPGRKGVIVTNCDISWATSEFLDILALYIHRVHKSLTRRILVVQKKAGF